MPPNQFQSRIQHEISDVSFSALVPHCLTSLLGNSNARYLPFDFSIGSSDCNSMKTKNIGSIFFEDGSFDISKGRRQGTGEMVPSPEQISSITSCCDGDAYFDSGFVGGQIFHGSCMPHASESPPQNYAPHSHFMEGKLNLTEHANLSDVYNTRFPAFLGGNSEIPSLGLQNFQEDSHGIPEASDNLPSADLDVPNVPCEGVLKPQLEMAGSGQDEFFSRLKDSEESYSFLEQSHSFGHTVFSEITSILLGPTGASKFVHLNEQTLHKDILSYMNYKRLHVNGSEVTFVQHMHSTVCNERTCNCDRFLLVSHLANCHRWECNICEPARRLCVTGKPPMESEKQENSRLVGSGDRECTYTNHDPAEDSSPPAKRLKTNSSVSFEMGVSCEVPTSMNLDCGPGQIPCLQQCPETPVSNYLDTAKYEMGVATHFQDSTGTESTRKNAAEIAQGLDLRCSPSHSEELNGCSKDDGDSISGRYGGVGGNVTDSFQLSNSCLVSLPSRELIVDQMDVEKEVKSDQAKIDVKSDSPSLTDDLGIKTVKPKLMGVSLIDFFEVEEVKDHLYSLGQFIGQETEGKAVTSVGENSCQLCAMEKLEFAPAPVYCSCCGARIKRSLFYHSAIDDMGTRHSFCTSCLKACRGGNISFHGICIFKSKLHKEINNHVDDESWVQCDKCKGWQHQICALYNDKRDLGGKSEYVCPKCYIVGVEVGDYKPLPRTDAFGAKELPTTKLSDYIEQRLFRRLKQEREERAKAFQKKYEEVPGAADLVVRVVLSVSKLLKVNQQFLDIIPDECYPTEFPFKSKVILLFQKIEGVDVCLFGIYVQEFGSDCAPPNQRCVYISYLDSVKYFRPEIKTASGEALRTLVYHEILIGYLEYCKKRGFATCYIWACPPVKGEDYILYCHPETQKTPKCDKLRHWYKSMLRKAAKEEIAVDCTNLHDHFFVPTGERNSKITVARLPYFDGDYWSVAAMNMIKNIEHGSQVGLQIKVQKVLTKRTLKAMGHSDLPGGAIKDILVMQKLGQTISPLKEDFIMVRLHFTCTRCHEVILSGSRWYCNQCKNFNLCLRCHVNEGNEHSSSSGEKHALFQAAVNDVPVETDDRDVILDNGYLEYRHSFLSFCQGNHYQFDTLRRAKHSSMLILYHLHNSTVPSVEATCCICDQNMLEKQGWHCVTCPEFNVCDGCKRRRGDDCHIHELSRNSSIVSCGLRNGQVVQNELLRVRGVMEGLLMHASQCTVTKSNTCPYPNCFQIRKLFRHARQCNLRLAGGCQICQKTWTLLRLHSENCKDSGCRVPRCLDLKKHAEMLALQSEARRRAAVLGSLRGC